MTEAELLAGLHARDERALAYAFETYADRLYRLALNLLQDEQQADGVVQDTFLTLLEQIDRFEGRSQVGTWLYRVAYNACLERLRAAKPTVDVETFDDRDLPLPTHLIDWGNLPDSLLSGQEALAQIRQAIEALPASLRTVFILRDVEGLSTEASAQILNLSAGAVKVRLHRARLALREALAEYFAEWSQA